MTDPSAPRPRTRPPPATAQPLRDEHYYRPEVLDEVLAKHRVWRAGRVEAAIRRKTIAHYRSRRPAASAATGDDGRQPGGEGEGDDGFEHREHEEDGSP